MAKMWLFRLIKFNITSYPKQPERFKPKTFQSISRLCKLNQHGRHFKNSYDTVRRLLYSWVAMFLGFEDRISLSGLKDSQWSKMFKKTQINFLAISRSQIHENMVHFLEWLGHWFSLVRLSSARVLYWLVAEEFWSFFLCLPTHRTSHTTVKFFKMSFFYK